MAKSAPETLQRIPLWNQLLISAYTCRHTSHTHRHGLAPKVTPTSKNQNPEQIARDQIDAKLA